MTAIWNTEPDEYDKRRQAWIAHNLQAATTTGGVVMTSKRRPNVKLLITPEPTEPTKWRITQVDERGPYAHFTFANRETSIAAASGEAWTDRVKGAPYYGVEEYEVTEVRRPSASGLLVQQVTKTQ